MEKLTVAGIAAGAIEMLIEELNKRPQKEQLHVDLLVEYSDLELTLDEFRQKFLKPAIKALAQRIPSSAKFLSLEIPENFKDALIVEREGCSLRLVSDETMILPEIDDFGNGKGLGHAALVMRFDVLFEQQ